MSGAPQTSDTVSVPQTTPMYNAGIRAFLPESVRVMMQNLASTSATQYQMQRTILQADVRPSTPTDDGCSSTCGSTCCD
jgi:hypothetical protein